MDLVCGTPASFVPAAADAAADAARTALATTITPALGAGVKNGTTCRGEDKEFPAHADLTSTQIILEWRTHYQTYVNWSDVLDYKYIDKHTSWWKPLKKDWLMKPLSQCLWLVQWR